MATMATDEERRLYAENVQLRKDLEAAHMGREAMEKTRDGVRQRDLARIERLEGGLESAVGGLDAARVALGTVYDDPRLCETLVELGAPQVMIDAARAAMPTFTAMIDELRTLLPAARAARAPRPADSEVADIEERLKLLRAASRPSEPLEALVEEPATWRSEDHSATVRRATAQGHILSAITQLERRRAELLGKVR